MIDSVYLLCRKKQQQKFIPTYVAEISHILYRGYSRDVKYLRNEFHFLRFIEVYNVIYTGSRARRKNPEGVHVNFAS